MREHFSATMMFCCNSCDDRIVEFNGTKIAEILRRSKVKAFRGGLSGAAAGAAQVITLMWLRTAVNYQYRYGGTMSDAMVQLYSQGGICRFYEGITFALIQGPLSRFGSVAANEGAIELSKILTKGRLQRLLISLISFMFYRKTSIA